MAKRKSKISNKMIGIMIGIAFTLSAMGVISSASVSYPHDRDANSMMTGRMMSGDMTPVMVGGDGEMMGYQDNTMADDMMHSMMMNENGGTMECMKMMGQAIENGEITQDELEEMMRQMDKDGDGQCDYCGMPIEMCGKTMSP